MGELFPNGGTVSNRGAVCKVGWRVLVVLQKRRSVCITVGVIQWRIAFLDEGARGHNGILLPDFEEYSEFLTSHEKIVFM